MYICIYIFIHIYVYITYHSCTLQLLCIQHIYEHV